MVNNLNCYYRNAGTAALGLKDKTFRSKTYLPKACNFHVQMPGSLNWTTKDAKKMFTRCGLGAACWLRDGPRGCLSGPEEAIDVWPRGGCWLQDEMPSQRFKGFNVFKGLEGFKGLRAGKRQAWTPIRSH